MVNILDETIYFSFMKAKEVFSMLLLLNQLLCGDGENMKLVKGNLVVRSLCFSRDERKMWIENTMCDNLWELLYIEL